MAFRVWHHPKNVSTFVNYSGDVSHRAVRICGLRDIGIFIAVAEYNLTPLFDVIECLAVCVVIAFSVCNRDVENLALKTLVGKECTGFFNSDVDRPTHKLERLIPEESAWQQTTFTQHLKTVAYAQDSAAAFGKVDNRRHDW